MKKTILILAILTTSCSSWPSSETITEVLASAETFARCAEIAHQCVEDLKPTKGLEDGIPVLVACKDQLLANNCKETIEALID